MLLGINLIPELGGLFGMVYNDVVFASINLVTEFSGLLVA